jgi:hypothetical protein
MAKESFIGGVNDSGKLAVITSKLIGAEIARHKGKRVLITVERFSSKRNQINYGRICTITATEDIQMDIPCNRFFGFIHRMRRYKF